MSDRDALRDAIAAALKRLPYADVIVPDDAWAGDYADAALEALEAAGVRMVYVGEAKAQQIINNAAHDAWRDAMYWGGKP